MKEDLHGFVSSVAGKNWVIIYNDKTKVTVDEDQLIEMRNAHNRRAFMDGAEIVERECKRSGPAAGHLIGRQVRRHFKGYGWYRGKVLEYDKGTKQYKIVYTDNEVHHLSEQKLQDILVKVNEEDSNLIFDK